MINENQGNSSELEPNRPDKSSEQSNLNDTQNVAKESKPDEGKNLPQHMHRVGPKRLEAPNITPEVAEQWEAYRWQAVVEAITISETRTEVYMLAKQWNVHNRPRIPEPELTKLIDLNIKRWYITFPKHSG